MLYQLSYELTEFQSITGTGVTCRMPPTVTTLVWAKTAPSFLRATRLIAFITSQISRKSQKVAAVPPAVFAATLASVARECYCAWLGQGLVLGRHPGK